MNKLTPEDLDRLCRLSDEEDNAQYGRELRREFHGVASALREAWAEIETLRGLLTVDAMTTAELSRLDKENAALKAEIERLKDQVELLEQDRDERREIHAELAAEYKQKNARLREALEKIATEAGAEFPDYENAVTCGNADDSFAYGERTEEIRIARIAKAALEKP